MNWIHTIKFKIVALAVVTGVLSAMATAELLLRASRADLVRQLLDNGASNRQAAAALIANKLNLLQATLTAIARKTRPELWEDPAALSRFLEDKPAAHVMFDVLFAADARGKMVVRLQRGMPSAELSDIGDQPYFQKAAASDQPLISEAVIDSASQIPMVQLAMATPTLRGQPTGIIAGSLALQSSSIFADVGQGDTRDGSRTLVMNRSGQLLAHPDPGRVLGNASDEPGLMEVYREWSGSVSPIDTDGFARLSGVHLISMAGIRNSDWVLVRMTPAETVLRPLHVAQRTAWQSAAGVGMLAALLAGVVGWLLTRPITNLRARAEATLNMASDAGQPWPEGRGELGALAHAFKKLEERRALRQGEVQALLRQLEAVLDHARVGIALTRKSVFELVSEHLCQTLGTTKGELQGQSTRIMYGSDEAYAALDARARPQFMAQGFFDGEVELQRRSGELFWAHMRGHAVVPGDLTMGTIWTVEDITSARVHREKLTWTSSHDSLTSLSNRLAFDALLVNATEAAREMPFCAMFIDLDHFKQVNDTAGHAAGDAVLRDVAKVLVAQVRKSDTVARLGGDEFAILLNECPLDHASEIAEKIRQAIVDYRLDWEGAAYGIGTSIGLVRVDGGFASAKEVLAAADNACYAAKSRGRNRVVIFGD